MRKALSVGLCLILLLNANCATIICGPDQEIHITSTPEGARIFVDGVTRGKTPMFTHLLRKRSHTVRIELAGYEEHSVSVSRGLNVWVFGNAIFLLAGVLTLLVDIGTGSSGNLTPDHVHAELIPVS